MSDSPDFSPQAQNEQDPKQKSEAVAWEKSFINSKDGKSNKPTKDLLDEAFNEGRHTSISKALTPFTFFDKDDDKVLNQKELQEAKDFQTRREERIQKAFEGHLPSMEVGKPMNIDIGEQFGMPSFDGGGSKVLDELIRNEEDRKLIAALSPDKGMSKRDLEELDRYAYVKEGLQFLSDHLSRVDSNNNGEISSNEIVTLASNPNLLPEIRVSVIKAAIYLYKKSDMNESAMTMNKSDMKKSAKSAWTKDQINTELKTIPKLPNLKKY